MCAWCVCILPKQEYDTHLTPGFCVAFVALVVRGAVLVKDSRSNPRPTGALALLRVDQPRVYARETGALLSCLMFNMADTCVACKPAFTFNI